MDLMQNNKSLITKIMYNRQRRSIMNMTKVSNDWYSTKRKINNIQPYSPSLPAHELIWRKNALTAFHEQVSQVIFRFLFIDIKVLLVNRFRWISFVIVVFSSNFPMRDAPLSSFFLNFYVEVVSDFLLSDFLLRKIEHELLVFLLECFEVTTLRERRGDSWNYILKVL